VHAVESRFVPLPAVRRWLAIRPACWRCCWRRCSRATARIHSRWAPLHFVLGVGSYGLFGAAVLHA
jgi:hypothetical protein